MNKDDIKQKARNFVNEYLEGFNDFTDRYNFIEMGIVTEEFVLSLMKFIEQDFHISISSDDGEEFYKNNLSINSIAKFIEKRLVVVSIDIDSLISEIKSCMVNVVGRIALEIEVNEDIRKTSFWDELETEFPGLLSEKFKIDMDLTKLNPLTLEKISDYIKQEQHKDVNGSRSAVKVEPEENEIQDFQLFKMVLK